jgi:formate dehydrogenase subunit delta
MELENLVHMANRIGEFFAAMPDREEAREGIANHVKRYWEPRMRTRLLDHLDEARASGLDALVEEAIRSRREALAVR